MLAVELEQQGRQGVGGLPVERTGGFVSQEEARFVDEGTDEGHALPFPAGQLAWQMIEPVAEADAMEELARALHAFGVSTGATAGDGGDQDILERRALGKQVVGLENKADLSVPEGGEFGLASACKRLTFERHGSGRGQVEGADDLEQRALSGA